MDSDAWFWEVIILYLYQSEGVQQGSILGPVLLTLYITKITSSVTNRYTHHIADDTVLHCFTNAAHSAAKIHKLLDALFNLKLALNGNKTK